MRERKPYPNVSDEELDRRAEEALRRMLANPQKAPGQGHGQGQGQNQGQRPPRNRQRRKNRR